MHSLLAGCVSKISACFQIEFEGLECPPEAPVLAHPLSMVGLALEDANSGIPNKWYGFRRFVGKAIAVKLF